jgi:hypothetical protein
LHFHWDSWKPLKTLLLLQREFKNACSTPPKNVTFFGWFCVSPQGQHFFSLHTKLRTILAVMSQTSAFLWMYRHCQALTYVMIITKVHRSTKDVCNVTWIVLTEEQKTCAT